MTAFTSWLTVLSAGGLGGVLMLLLPLGVAVFAGACVAFVWAVRGSQFDNLDVEARRILFEPGSGLTGDANAAQVAPTRAVEGSEKDSASCPCDNGIGP